MPNAGRTAQALSVVTALGLAAITSAQAHLVEDFGVRRGAPAHISVSTGFNGFVGAGTIGQEAEVVASEPIRVLIGSFARVLWPVAVRRPPRRRSAFLVCLEPLFESDSRRRGGVVSGCQSFFGSAVSGKLNR